MIASAWSGDQVSGIDITGKPVATSDVVETVRVPPPAAPPMEVVTRGLQDVSNLAIDLERLSGEVAR